MRQWCSVGYSTATNSGVPAAMQCKFKDHLLSVQIGRVDEMMKLRGDDYTSTAEGTAQDKSIEHERWKLCAKVLKDDGSEREASRGSG